MMDARHRAFWNHLLQAQPSQGMPAWFYELLKKVLSVWSYSHILLQKKNFGPNVILGTMMNRLRASF